MIYHDAKAALATTLRFYEDHAADFVKGTAGMDLGDLPSLFCRNLPVQARILDAGCGSGRDSAEFLSRGYSVTAIDASPAMVRVATIIGVPAEVMTFQELEFENEFDGIWACSSLLHVPHQEIRGVLDRLARALKAGGVLLVTLKEGYGEEIADDGRFFAYYELEEFSDILSEMAIWSHIDSRETTDCIGRGWSNYLARKASRPVRESAVVHCRDHSAFGLLGGKMNTSHDQASA